MFVTEGDVGTSCLTQIIAIPTGIKILEWPCRHIWQKSSSNWQNLSLKFCCGSWSKCEILISHSRLTGPHDRSAIQSLFNIKSHNSLTSLSLRFPCSSVFSWFVYLSVYLFLYLICTQLLRLVFNIKQRTMNFPPKKLLHEIFIFKLRFFSN